MKKILLLDPGVSFSQDGTRNAVRQAPHIGLISIAMAIKELGAVKLLEKYKPRLDQIGNTYHKSTIYQKITNVEEFEYTCDPTTAA